MNVLDKPIYADLILILFLDNIPIESFEKIVNDDVIIQALNMKFVVPRPYLIIFSPVEVSESIIIDLLFDVTNESATWFIQKLEDTNNKDPHPTTSKKNAWSMIKSFKSK